MKTPIGNGKRNAVKKLKEVSEIRIYVRLIVGCVRLTRRRRQLVLQCVSERSYDLQTFQGFVTRGSLEMLLW